MRSMRRTVGRVSFGQAAREIQQPTGRHKRLPFQTTQMKVPVQLIKKLDRKLRTRYKPPRKGKPAETKLRNAVIFQREVLERLKGVGRKLNAIELVASLIREHGFEKENLMPFLNAALALERAVPRNALFVGTIGNMLKSVNNGSLQKIDSLLQRTQQQLHTTSNIASVVIPGFSSMIGVERKQALIQVAAALGVLEAMKQVSREPLHQNKQFTWVNFDHRTQAPKPTHNIGYRVFTKLKETGPIHQTELVARLNLPSSHVVSQLGHLEKAGVVQTKYVSGVKGKTGAVKETRLTRFGQQLATAQEKARTILPEVREILVGERTGKPSKAEERTRDRIARWLTIVNLRQKTGWGERRIARELKIPVKYVVGIIREGTKPYSVRSGPEYFLTQIELLKRKDLTLGRQFEKYCKEQGLIPKK
ncbi:MAG: hypothetical protein Q7S92_04035 [Candidatus Diapherotrites archaeon]|nr:hypothetical protein [Candidatus Diapherotrites archaeon]